MTIWNYLIISMWFLSLNNDYVQHQDNLEDTKGVIGSRKLKKDRQQWPQENEQRRIYKTLHRKLKIDNQEPH